MNYNNCITNLACSIRKEFGLEYKHETIKEVDDIFNKNNYESVVVILCDGMGSSILNNNLESRDFLIKNKIKDISSVVPSTTTAATTSMLSGLNPCEHGWLGWDMYYKNEEKIVTMFLNTLKDSDVPFGNVNLANKYFPYKNIIEEINEVGKFTSKILFPFGDNSYNGFDDMLHKIKKEISVPGKKYIYAYYTNPDSIMHVYGTKNVRVKANIEMINKKLEDFSKEIENTLLIVTADHGHIDSEEITLSQYPEITNLLDNDIWIEGRLCAFSVKDNKYDEFKLKFKKLFGDYFYLKTKKEVIDEKLFGDGLNHVLFEESVGDFIAVAYKNKYFRSDEESVLFKSMHAGVTDDEMKIPLIVVEKK